MGNHLVGIAPSQIYPVEHYLMGSFESNLQYESSMGSTRFFKVARVRSDEGLIVIKVFVKHDPSLPLETHADRVMFIQKALANAVNCLPFQRVQVTEKVALVMREYVKHSLYDRVSTRPFLTSLEKKWITFQVLCALHQCHRQKICHGDIKLENILITSWNWILLSDFASFKPTYLPEDNPADYTYFFDTSRRRTCYVAPERFVKSYSNDANNAKSGILIGGSSLLSASIMDGIQTNDQNSTANLLPEMDIFSAGCALLELWGEGTTPFEFSQLLAYRSGDLELVTKHLDELENENLQNLIASMISRNPADRKSAEVYLDEQRGKLFPEYFYTFLQSYMQMFSSLQILPPDDKIMRLYSDIKQIIDIFLPSNNEQETRTIPDDDGLILITAVVTSCIRGLKYCKTKLHCLEILQQLSMYTTSETVLDRILPYILHLCNDNAARVRVSALDTLTMCIRLVKDLPRNDANIFPEYVLPSIAPLAMDNSVVVRIAYARNVADIAETALYFLDQTQLNATQELPTIRYETELSALHEMLHQTVSHLLTDAQPIVKQTVIECGITKLCVFFGRQKANDLILSHMITFLNDKEDKSLRGSFFDCIVGVATFVGWQCSDILLPLLQQGLTDSEEFVIAKAIRATTALTGLGLIQKPALSEFITECACYLNHPNLWIRHEVCGLISSAAKIFGAIDVQCKIMPAIINHLKCPLIQVEKPEILMDCLQPAIPRNIYDSVVRFTELELFFTLLEERKKARDSTIDSLPQQCEMTSPVRNFFRRISCEGLTDTVEKQILSMKSSILKLNKYLKKVPTDKYSTNGKIFIDSKLEIGKELVLADTKKQLITNRKSDADNPNLDWPRMYPHSDKSTSPLSDYHSPGVSSNSHYNDTPSTSLVEYSMPEKNFIQERNSDCRNELHMLHNKLKSQYVLLNANSDSNAAMKRASMIPAGHSIKGTLIAHLHEHKSSVTKLTALSSSSSLFASASTDGTVRLFDCNKLNGHQSINKSRQMYSANVPIYSIAACDSGQSLAVAGNDGSLLLLQIDPNSSKMALQQARHLVQNAGGYNGYDDGPIVDMHPLDPDSQSVIIYATLYGAIICWDLRMPTNAWRLNSDLKQGVITTFCIDSNVSWLATGTSHGNHICWDLRFKLPIAKIQHPSATRIRKIIPHPTESSWLISTSHGNNEVSVWNIETSHRQAALWASSAPPLSKESKNTSSVCGVVSCIVDRSPVLFTGSSDQRIRYWDLSTRANCSMISPASRDYASGSNFSYDSRLIDGTRVIYEVQTQNKSHAIASGLTNTLKSDDYSPRSGPEMPLPCHNNVVTDLLMCRTQKYPVLISSSRDGVIKLWK